MTRLEDKLAAGTATIAVIGMGYVGLPLALAFAEKGLAVVGLDVDADKVAQLNAGKGYLQHLDGGRVAGAVASGKLTASTDFDRLREADAIVICVPTPLTKQREPDLSYVESTAREIAARLQPGQLVVLESTTYPGTTDELVLGILEGAGKKCGTDFYLAFSPEREDPGNLKHTTVTIPKVVGGVDEASTVRAVALYETVIGKVVPVSSARAAEATKLTENIFRAVNIALVNELKVVYDRMGIDVWEVLDAASTKPFGFMRFNPGPGLGGHCIPLDPFYLTWKAREFGLATRFIELAGQVNVSMPGHVFDKTMLALNERGKAVKAARVIVLGVAYKKNIDDCRESPAYPLLQLLQDRHADVAYHDPHVAQLPPSHEFPRLKALASTPLNAATLAAADAVVIVTDHGAIDFDLVLEHAPLVVDARGVYREPRDSVVKA